MDRYLELLKEQTDESKSVLLLYVYTVPWGIVITMLLGFFNLTAGLLVLLLLAPISFFIIDSIVAFIHYKYER